MSYTDEQIIQSLPPALQGELKEFGAPETKTSAQIREFLLEKRKAYNLPPWHAFTLLMKRAARRTGDLHKLSDSTRWYLAAGVSARVHTAPGCHKQQNTDGIHSRCSCCYHCCHVGLSSDIIHSGSCWGDAAAAERQCEA